MLKTAPESLRSKGNSKAQQSVANTLHCYIKMMEKKERRNLTGPPGDSFEPLSNPFLNLCSHFPPMKNVHCLKKELTNKQKLQSQIHLKGKRETKNPKRSQNSKSGSKCCFSVSHTHYGGSFYLTSWFSHHSC